MEVKRTNKKETRETVCKRKGGEESERREGRPLGNNKDR